MAIATTCPNCKAIFRLADELAGKTVKCQKCQQMFVVPEGSADTVAVGTSVPVELEAPPAVLLARAPAPLPPPPAPPPILERAEEKEAIEERESGRDEPPPLPNKRRPLSEPRRRDEPAKAGSGATSIVLAILGLSVLLCVVCSGISVGVYVLRPEAKKPVVIRDKGKRDFMFKEKDKFDRGIMDAKDFAFKDFKDIPKDAIKDGVIMPPQPPQQLPAPPLVNQIPVAFGPGGNIVVNDKLVDADPLWNARNKRVKVFAVRMEANKQYEIDMTSNVFDSYLFLYDDVPAYVAHDDDGGGFPSAKIVFRPRRTATYFVVATTFEQVPIVGAFSLSIRRN